MKKFLAIVLAAVMVMSLCSTAFATTFTRTVQCVNESDYVKSVLSTNTTTSGTKVKIRYNAQGCSNSYTNHFRVWNNNTARQTGSKFVTPGGTYYITCSQFAKADYYVDMRGNTKYNQNEGLSNIVLAGWFQLPSQY